MDSQLKNSNGFDPIHRKPRQTITSVDVAKMTGFSQSAVSRAFSSTASIKESTRNKIMEAARSIGYYPNAIARSLIKNKSNIIGIVVGKLNNHFYPLVIEKISYQLQKKNYHLLFFFTESYEVDHIINQLLEYRVDGAIFTSISLKSNLIDQCYRSNIPLVLFNRLGKNPKTSSVQSDNYLGSCQLTDHLLNLGHRKIAFIAGDENSSTSIQREKGLLDSLAKKKLKLFKRAQGNYHFQQSAKATHMICQDRQHLPDAIFAASDHMAISVMDTLRYRLKIKVPDQISVVGYDDIPQASWESYQLTTIHQPLDEMVGATLNLLMQNIDQQKNTSYQLKIKGNLIVRKSSSRKKYSF